MRNYKQIQISVIIPTWNRAHLLKRAIKSALNQSLSPLEILICDDGSTDDTFKMIKSFKDKRIKWITADHLGLPAVVRNRGIKESKGEWIAFLDSDDEWFPKKLEKQMTLARQTECLAVCCNAYSVNLNGQRKKYLDCTKKILTFSDLIKVNYVILSSAVIHRSLLSKCLGFPEGHKFRNAPDYAFWLRVLTQTNIAYLDEIFVNYLDEPNKSIRRFAKNPYLLKKIILEDFLHWSIKNIIPFRYILKAYFQYLSTSIDFLRKYGY